MIVCPKRSQTVQMLFTLQYSFENYKTLTYFGYITNFPPISLTKNTIIIDACAMPLIKVPFTVTLIFLLICSLLPSVVRNVYVFVHDHKSSNRQASLGRRL